MDKLFKGRLSSVLCLRGSDSIKSNSQHLADISFVPGTDGLRTFHRLTQITRITYEDTVNFAVEETKARRY